MIGIHINNDTYRKYTRAFNCIVTGYGFYQGNFLEGEAFNKLISTWVTEKEFIEGIQALNGYYAIISQRDGQLFVAVDRVRSVPLFYAVKDGKFYLSDSAHWVCEQVGNKEMNQLARQELFLTEQVTGSETLFSDVKQLQAGEAIIVTKFDGTINVKPFRYYEYLHDYKQNRNLDELFKAHQKVLDSVFSRLIAVADGRTIVVPLSGGYDSRLVVLMLKKLGYNNVITFSYGRPNNKESEVSRTVANSLGFDWLFVPYSNEDWNEWFNSDERKRYWNFSSNLCSLGFIQDWPAVWQLYKNNLIPKDSLFVPGHSGDFISGRTIPTELVKTLRNDENPLNRLVSIIWRRYYSLNELDCSNEKSIRKALRNKITCICKSKIESGAYINAPSILENWVWQERQAKFIVNSVRVYEFWGYNWWLPLWDYEYMQFWCGVPLELKIGQTMYKEFVNQLTKEMVGCIVPRDDLHPSLKQRVINTLRPYLNEATKDKIKRIAKTNKFSIESVYQSHPLAYYGIVDEDYFKKYYSGKEHININSFLTRLYFEEISSCRSTR